MAIVRKDVRKAGMCTVAGAWRLQKSRFVVQGQNQTVDFKPLNMKPGDEEVVVKSEVKQPGGQAIPIDYSMYQTAFGWKVYDVSIDGVSLVTNYRSSFSTKIRQSGIDGLISQLASQSQKQAAPIKKRAKSGS